LDVDELAFPGRVQPLERLQRLLAQPRHARAGPIEPGFLRNQAGTLANFPFVSAMALSSFPFFSMTLWIGMPETCISRVTSNGVSSLSNGMPPHFSWVQARFF